MPPCLSFLLPHNSSSQLYVGDHNGPQYICTEAKSAMEPADLIAAVNAGHSAITVQSYEER